MFRLRRTALAVCVSCAGLAQTTILSDDFNRPDGPVGNGWAAWNGSALSGGQVVTFGSDGAGGGIYRALPITFPVSFAFDFRSDGSDAACGPGHPGGGWVIAFNTPGGGYSGAQYEFYQYNGAGPIGRHVITPGGPTDDSVPSTHTDFGPSFVRISGTINADLSATLTVDGHTYTFGAIGVAPPTGSNLVLSNSICGGGPYIFDNLTISTPGPGDSTGPITSNVVISPNPLRVNTASTITGIVDDSTTGGSYVASATYRIDTGMPVQMSLAPVSAVRTQVLAGVAPFSQPNIYRLCVRGTDVPGNAGAENCLPLPVYDPNAGFTLGAGTILSAPGSDLLNPTAAGQIIFGFASAYLPAATVPSGDLTLQFRAGSLNFQSTSFAWLVVTGEPRARFKGTGKINGTYTCQFQLDAWDKSFSASRRDALGLEIFSCNGAAGPGGRRYLINPTPLSSGAIFIHR